MNKIRLLTMIIGSAVFLTAVFVFQAFGAAGSAKTGAPQFIGLTVKNCFSAAYHSATDCDRLASAPYLNAVTVSSSNGPTAKNCYSAAYFAATDCDRLASKK